LTQLDAALTQRGAIGWNKKEPEENDDNDSASARIGGDF
jgi:hypothetical protein